MDQDMREEADAFEQNKNGSTFTILRDNYSDWSTNASMSKFPLWFLESIIA